MYTDEIQLRLDGDVMTHQAKRMMVNVVDGRVNKSSQPQLAACYLKKKQISRWTGC